MMTRGWVAALVLLAAGATGAVSARQGPSPEVRARIDAFVKGVNADTADGFEAMAQANFTPGMLARRTAADREQMFRRLKSDFGTMTVERVMRNDDTLELRVKGSTGIQATIALDLEAAAPFRIMSMRVELGDAESRQSLPPVPVTGAMTADQLASTLDGYVAPMAAADTFSGTILVAKAGVPVFQKAYGLADRDKRVANTMATRFNIGSINKMFTKTAIAQLVAKGTLSLDDTIGKLLPDYPDPQARTATVAQLLGHTAGIADFFGEKFDGADKTRFRSNRDYYQFVSGLPMTFAPGTRRQYCNGCYIVLGEIVARASGLAYEDYIAQHVFQPAGMKTAAFLHTDQPAERMAIGYTHQSPNGPQNLHNNVSMHGVAGSGAGGAYASAADLLAFADALRHERLLDTTMTNWFFGPDGGPVAAGGAGDRSLGVAGGAPGLNASLETDASWDVVVLANLDPPAAVQLGVGIARALRAHP